MKKIAFFGIFGGSRYTYNGGMQRCDAMPRSSGSSLENILELYEVTDNKGNMIHGEAPARFLELDREGSCYVSVEALVVKDGWSPEKISSELNKRFDLVVFSTANAIRPNLDPGCTAQVLDLLSIDFIVVGMGMQDSLPASTDALHPNLVDLLDVCNRKATIFWVRGQETQNWLNSVGYHNAKALGCPSMYVYPDNILNICAPNPDKVSSAVTSGYIHGRIPRATSIIGLFRDFDAHYVMQEEMFAWKQQGLIPDSCKNLYNDATGEINRDFVKGILEEIHYEKMPFSSYRWFQDPNAWRMFVSKFDFYLGDRLHGGIVSLQAGIPTIMMAEDKRVIEITDFFGIPQISSKEADLLSLKSIVKDYLSPFKVNLLKDTYFDRFNEFEKVFKEADIPLTISLKIPKPVSSYKKTVTQPRKSSPNPIRLIRSLIRKI